MKKRRFFEHRSRLTGREKRQSMSEGSLKAVVFDVGNTHDRLHTIPQTDFNSMENVCDRVKLLQLSCARALQNVTIAAD
ncbi:MAG: hypothetical protein RBJ76_01235 [Stenomitos frigidus ULC029]